VALLDTNCNPDPIAYPIPGNDDATKAIKLITTLIADTIIEGRKKFLAYLTESGVPRPGTEGETQEPALLPEEEVKIKEIEEIVETAAPGDDQTKPVKKGRPRTAQDEKLKTRRKV
jgi:small subunit ribosomal protein S2